MLCYSGLDCIFVLEKHVDEFHLWDEEEIVLQSRKLGTRLEAESMGRSLVLINEVNARVVVLTCYGELAPFDELAVTLSSSEEKLSIAKSAITVFKAFYMGDEYEILGEFE